MTGRTYDVLVVGYGPVGALLAGRLGAAGLSVLVVDRATDVHPLPRGVAADGEVLALLERAAPGATDGFLLDPDVRFVDAGRRELGQLRFPSPGLAFYRQPVLERRLRAAVSGDVELRLGASLLGLVQDDDGVTARLADGPPLDPARSPPDGSRAPEVRREGSSGGVGGEQVRARWLVGCDGASSTVRSLLRVGWLGRDLPQRWLVCDVDGPPVAGRQRFTYTCDPARPQVDLPVPGGHRWEWLVRGAGPLPDAASLLAADADPAQLQVVREVEYRFSARRAQHWRVGRVLLAGDAAHTMPPFAGQGLGAGLRDAWALGALLPRGAAGVDLYEPLRAPHVRRMTQLSLLLGGLLQTGAPVGARARDAALRRAFAAPLLGPWLQRGGPRPDVSGVLDL